MTSPLPARTLLARTSLFLGALSLALGSVACSGGDTSGTDDGESALSGHAPPVTVASGAVSAREVATHDGYAYWTDSNAIRVLKAPVTGGTPTVLYQGKGLDALGGIVVDDDSVYFNDDGQILRIGHDGGKVSVVVRLRYDFPSWIAQDDQYVYWTGMSDNHADYSVYIRRVKKTGGAIETVYTGYKGGNDIAVDDAYVYFYGSSFEPGLVMNRADYVLRVKKDGSAAPETLAELPDTLVRAIAIDDANVYYASAHEGFSLSSLPKSGGVPTELRHVSNAPTNEAFLLRATEASLYWATPGTFTKDPNGDHNATLHRMAKAGGRAQIIADSLDVPNTLAWSAGSCPVWTTSTAVLTVGTCP